VGRRWNGNWGRLALHDIWPSREVRVHALQSGRVPRSPRNSRPTSRTRRGRRAWLFAGGILTPVAVLLSTVTLWSWANKLAADTETQHQTYTQPVSRVALNLHNGDVILTPGVAGQVVIERRLEWSESKPTIEET
jgi:hypothetical protein